MADDGPLPPAPFVEYDPELLLEDMGHLQVPIVINAVSLAALRILTAAIDTVRVSGDAMYRLALHNRIIQQLDRFVGNYCQVSDPVMIAGTKVRYNDMLAGESLGLLYKRRGYLEIDSHRVGRNGNFIQDASFELFNLVSRIPDSENTFLVLLEECNNPCPRVRRSDSFICCYVLFQNLQ